MVDVIVPKCAVGSGTPAVRSPCPFHGKPSLTIALVLPDADAHRRVLISIVTLKALPEFLN